jgi:hypothetical protein
MDELRCANSNMNIHASWSRVMHEIALIQMHGFEQDGDHISDGIRLWEDRIPIAVILLRNPRFLSRKILKLL